MIKIPKLGLGSGSTLEARARLGLEKFGLVPPLIYHTQEYDTFTGLMLKMNGVIGSGGPSLNSQDDYTRCRGLAEVPKIRVTSLAGPRQLRLLRQFAFKNSSVVLRVPKDSDF